MNRKARAWAFIERNASLFQCAHCGGPLHAQESGVCCDKGHRTDLSRKGTMAFSPRKGDARYGKELFSARRTLIKARFFQPLVEGIIGAVEKPAVVLDAGCGEGTLLAQIQEAYPDAVCIGADLSAQAIEAASSHTQENRLFLKADLAALPIARGTVDLILNILSPASYGEFRRIAAPGAQVIKVIPTAQHLMEVRQALGKEYAHEGEAHALFLENCTGVRTENYTYTKKLDAPARRALFAMTPLAAQEDLGDVEINEITFSFILCMGYIAAKNEATQGKNGVLWKNGLQPQPLAWRV